MASPVLSEGPIPRRGVVGTLARLRFRILANSLRRSPVQLVAVILGALQVLGMGAFGLVTGWLQSFNSIVFERQAPEIIVGSVIVLVWVLAPLVLGGAEPALDPRKLARFGVTPWRLMRAEFVVGVAWFPAVATWAAALALMLTWRDRPWAVLAAFLSSFLVVASCVVASRAATTLAADLVARHGSAGRVVATLVAGAVLLLPVVVVLLLEWPPWRNFASLTNALAVTPLGAAWAIPGFFADGRVADGVVAVISALLWLLVFALLWFLGLRRALASRPTAGRRRTARLGVLGGVATGPVGAIYGRSLVLWFRDPRLVIQLVVLPVVPALLLVLAVVDRVDWFAYLAAPVAAALLPLTQFAGISYDGTAFASELAAAVRGVADRAGRAAAVLAIALPVIVIVAVAAPLVVGSAVRVPAEVGLALAALCSAVGVAGVSSAFIAVPVAAAGKNPFASPPGSNTIQVLGSYIVTAVTVVVLAPVLVLGIVALVTASPVLGWWTLGVGLVWGAAALVAGVVIGGRILDQQAPALLERLRKGKLR